MCVQVDITGVFPQDPRQQNWCRSSEFGPNPAIFKVTFCHGVDPFCVFFGFENRKDIKELICKYTTSLEVVLLKPELVHYYWVVFNCRFRIKKNDQNKVIPLKRCISSLLYFDKFLTGLKLWVFIYNPICGNIFLKTKA